MIFRNGNVKMNCDKDAIQADKGRIRKRKGNGLDKDIKCQIENLKSTDQKGPLAGVKNEDTWKKRKITCYNTSSLRHPRCLLEISLLTLL